MIILIEPLIKLIKFIGSLSYSEVVILAIWTAVIGNIVLFVLSKITK